MVTELDRAFGRTYSNERLGLNNRHKRKLNLEHKIFHFAFAHPDDEAAVLKLLNIITENDNLEASITLLSNASHGFRNAYTSEDGRQITSHEDYGELRVEEFQESLRRLDLNQNRIEALLDERTWYNQITVEDENLEPLYQTMDRIIDYLTTKFKQEKPSAIFVNDFAGGHPVHDFTSYIVCEAARRSKSGPVLEFWQYIIDNTKTPPGLIVGTLGTDEQGRVLRDSIPGKYTPEISEFGIHKGIMFLGPTELQFMLTHITEVYKSQKGMINFLLNQTLSYGFDAPRFREINLDTIDHTLRPSHGVYYDQQHVTTERARGGISRTPTFEDFARLIKGYEARKARTIKTS